MHTPLCPPNGALVGYTLLRHLGLMLDELSSQGLELWQDDRHAWRWHWMATDLKSERGFWALGEAIVDAVVGSEVWPIQIWIKRIFTPDSSRWVAQERRNV